MEFNTMDRMERFTPATHCPDCFSPSPADPVCPGCGFDRRSYTDNNKYLPEFSQLAPGVVVGRALGEGGFGIVYSGHLEALGNVAIKEFFPEGVQLAHRTRDGVCVTAATDKEKDFEFWRRRFYQEAQLLWRFRDVPTIVNPAREPLQVNGTYYLVMERLRGCHLAEYLGMRDGVTRRTLSVEQALSIYRSILKTLQVMHDSDPPVFHRDITPLNIFFIDRNIGNIKVLDFGLARSGESILSTLAARGTMAGTPEFAGPEQLQGGTIGAYTDIYSSAAVIYTALYGRNPPPALSRFKKHEQIDFSPRTDIPPPLQQTLQLCLALNPQERPQSVAAVLEMLAGKTAAGAETIAREEKPAEDNAMTLVPEARLYIKVKPRRAEINIDELGGYRNGMRIKPGIYHLTVTHGKFEPHRETVHVSQGDFKKTIKLRKPAEPPKESFLNRWRRRIVFWFRFSVFTIMAAAMIYAGLWIKNFIWPDYDAQVDRALRLETKFHYDKARSLLKRAAKSGHGGAMRHLARHYEHGLGVDIEPDRANRWLVKSVENGDGLAMIKLAGKYRRGGQLPLNYPEAASLLARAAGLLPARGISELAMFYRELDDNPASAFRTLAQARLMKTIEYDDYHAHETIYLYSDRNLSVSGLSCESAVKSAIKAMQADDTTAMDWYIRRMGKNNSEHGCGTPVPNRSFLNRIQKVYLKYAEAGRIGRLLVNFEKNRRFRKLKYEKQLVKWLKRAASINNISAQYQLARYLDSLGGRNKKEAAQYYRLAADHGHLEAALHYYWTGRRQHLDKLAALGHIPSIYKLAGELLNRDGDSSEAWRMMSQVIHYPGPQRFELFQRCQTQKDCRLMETAPPRWLPATTQPAPVFQDALGNGRWGPVMIPIREEAWSIGVHEVTLADYLYYAMLHNKPVLSKTRYQNTDNILVAEVTLDDARAYARWLSEKTGKHYRIATPREWRLAVGADEKADDEKPCGNQYTCLKRFMAANLIAISAAANTVGEVPGGFRLVREP